jgi:hypothetical protein
MKKKGSKIAPRRKLREGCLATFAVFFPLRIKFYNIVRIYSVITVFSYGIIKGVLVRLGMARYGLEHGWSLAGTLGQRVGFAGTYFVSFPWYEPVLGEIICTQYSRNTNRIVMVDTWTISGCFMENCIFGNANRKF